MWLDAAHLHCYQFPSISVTSQHDSVCGRSHAGERGRGGGGAILKAKTTKVTVQENI